MKFLVASRELIVEHEPVVEALIVGCLGHASPRAIAFLCHIEDKSGVLGCLRAHRGALVDTEAIGLFLILAPQDKLVVGSSGMESCVQLAEGLFKFRLVHSS